MTEEIEIGAQIHIKGIVQGVGFRPFIYSLATKMQLNGWVQNSSAGVDIHVDGTLEEIAYFIHSIKNNAPPLARIDELTCEHQPLNGYKKFEIIHSRVIREAFQPISPDVSVCDDCLEELFDPEDRRYLYPFINCTNCGPRFTIIKDIPYDRPKTTMMDFPLCSDCESEYNDPLNRRFHAQPVACQNCGPHIWLEYPLGSTASNIEGTTTVIQHVQDLLAQGKIIAIKGLGGFHLACDATNSQAVHELRNRKLRVDKPFALMMADLATIEQNCYLNKDDLRLIISRQRPIVILERKSGSVISHEIAPGQSTIGVMLPYTPLHYLLFHDIKNRISSQLHSPSSNDQPLALVMTSGNLSEEPIAIDNSDARERLSTLADAFLMHNRPIHTRCDDSVVRTFTFMHNGQKPTTDNDYSPIYPIRRSRGYSPFPVHLPRDTPPVLATGGELKNAFCITRGRYAFISHHIGDMENYETFQSFENGIDHYECLFRIKPQIIAYDKHPNYLASRYALERAERQNIPTIGVQHHHAHIAACMIENDLPSETPVIGIAFDGTGYGDDGAIWGGEIMLADFTNYQRFAHLAYTPLPGGDRAIRNPARIALAHLWNAGLDWNVELAPVGFFCADERTTLLAQLEHKINTPLTSSFGRLFDAVAALTGVRQTVNYEAQAAIELESLIDPTESGVYKFDLHPPEENSSIDKNLAYSSKPPNLLIDPTSLLQEIVSDLLRGLEVGRISARFHNGVVDVIRRVVIAMRNEFNINNVVLSGGVWQNMYLLKKTVEVLSNDGFSIYIHRKVPANDGGLALGQAAIAIYKVI